MTPRRRRVLADWLVAAAMIAATTVATATPVLQFTLPTLQADRFLRLSDWHGQAVMLNFWSSDCPPCRHEWPVLQATAHPGVARLGVAVDQRVSALKWVAKRGSAFPQVQAGNAPAALLARFGNLSGALPYTVVLDSVHRVCATHYGAVEATWLAQAMARCAAPDATAPR